MVGPDNPREDLGFYSEGSEKLLEGLSRGRIRFGLLYKDHNDCYVESRQPRDRVGVRAQ